MFLRFLLLSPYKMRSFNIIAAAVLLFEGATAAKVSNADTSLTFIYQNNLNASDDVNHRGAILLDPMTATSGAKACANLGETLLLQRTIENHKSDFAHSLSYLEYAGLATSKQQFHVQNGVVVVKQASESIQVLAKTYGNEKLPVLCSQSSHQNGASNAKATASNEISIKSIGNTYIGFRNQKSFRFVGIPYANPTGRFEYSTVHNKKGQTITATTYGADCAQQFDDTSKESCLFMNIQAPYIPKAGSKENLRPVLMSIYGGGFTGGNSGPDSGLDTGNMASREDIVGVQFNYRLSTLGFLAIPGTDIKGNFGIGDQVTALRWVRENIAQFGGDPEKITIIGESAGAGSVRALLGSPPVIEENLIVGAVAQSNLGGGVTLGLDSDYGTTYSSLRHHQSVVRARWSSNIPCGWLQSDKSRSADRLSKGCPLAEDTRRNNSRKICRPGWLLRQYRATRCCQPERQYCKRECRLWHHSRRWCQLLNFPCEQHHLRSQGIERSLDISAEYANLIADSGLFPFYDTGNLTLDSFSVSQRVATDKTFRCIDEATVYAGVTSGAFKSAYYYTMERTYEGYDPNGLGSTGLSQGPVRPKYPNGDPNLPYFRLHGSDLGFTYGNQNPLRDADDLKASQLISGYFAQFAKTGNPNPSLEYLQVRGYTNVSSKDRILGVRPTDLLADYDGCAKKRSMGGSSKQDRSDERSRLACSYG